MFNDFSHLENSYTASNAAYEPYGTPPHSGNSTFENGWSTSGSSARIGAPLPTRIGRGSPPSSDHAFSHAVRSSDHHPTHGSYNAYASPPYTPQDGPRHSSYHDSYGRPVVSSRRPGSDMTYHMSSGHGSAQVPVGRERSRSQWTGSVNPRELPHPTSSHSANYGWASPAESQYLNLDPHWTGNPSPTASPDMTLLVPANDFSLGPMSISPRLDSSGRHISPASSSSSPPSSRRGSVDHSGGNGVKSCSHCHATSTPLWRREPNTLRPLCNACGLYLQQRHKHRPQELIDADAAEEASESEGETSGPECSHCHTHHTSVWRRSKEGAQLCNACGVYVRLRGKPRPVELRRKKIKPRTKHTPPSTPS